MTEFRPVLTDLMLVESPRWHDDRLVFSDWGAATIVVLDPDGSQRDARPGSRDACRSASTGCRTAGCWPSPRPD